MKKLLTILSALSLSHAEDTTSVAVKDMTSAAKEFIASLDQEQKSKTVFPFDSNERENFKFTPQARKGLSLEAMSDTQRALAKKLLSSALSRDGVQKAETISQLESYLRELEHDPVKRNPLAYYTSIFGEPRENGTWAWNWEGHHCSFDVTIVDGKIIAAAPTFMGANPAKVLTGDLKDTQPFKLEESIARSLVNEIITTHKEVIFSEKAPGEIITAENRKAELLAPVGITSDSLTETQRKTLLDLLALFAKRYRPAIADEQMKNISALSPNEIHFGWAGGTAENQAYYYRIQTPQLLVEVVNVQNKANHIHTVWRDVKNDFARDFLQAHLKSE